MTKLQTMTLTKEAMIMIKDCAVNMKNAVAGTTINKVSRLKCLSDERRKIMITMVNLFDCYDDVLVVPEVAKALRVSRNTAYKLISSGKLRHIKIGAKIVVPKPYLIEYMQKNIK